MKPEKRCSQIDWKTWGSSTCQKKAKVERYGKQYCTIHDPEYVERKQKERQEKWYKEQVEKKRKWDEGAALRQIEKAAPVMLEALKNLVSRIDEGLAIGEALDLKPAREAIAEAGEKDV